MSCKTPSANVAKEYIKISINMSLTVSINQNFHRSKLEWLLAPQIKI